MTARRTLELTDRAAALVDVAALHALLPIRSEPGRRALARARPFGPGALPAWRDERARTRALEAWLTDDATRLDRITRTLDAARDLRDPLERLDGVSALREPDLFRLLRLLRVAGALVDALGTLATTDPAAPDPGWIAAWIAQLDPAGDGRSTFAIVDAFDPRLPALRSGAADARRDESGARTARRTAVESRVGCRIDREGRVAFPIAAGTSTTDPDDPDLELVVRTPREIVYRLRETPDLLALRERREAEEAAVARVEEDVLERLSAELRPVRHELERMRDWIGAVDLRAARIRLRATWAGCWPDDGEHTTLVAARHPLVEATLAGRNRAFTPIDLVLERGATALTGPNMGGKSVALALVATLQWLAQSVWPIPADHATVRFVDRIDHLGGDAASMADGLSSFGAEMCALREMTSAAGTALLLLDEPCRATNPDEGAALTRAILSWLQRSPHTGFVATHHPGIARVAGRRLRVRGLGDEALADVAADTDDASRILALARRMDYAIDQANDAEPPRTALRVAGLLGVPAALLDEADDWLARSRDISNGEDDA